MKLRRSVVIGVVTAAAIGSLGIVPAQAWYRGHTLSSDSSLRALGARHDLAIGTAVDVSALDDTSDPQYRALVKSQFSTVTPENVMKWEVLEPTRGTYDWTQADELVDFARQNHQQVRGHVLAWHQQLPKWLTDGVADGSIDKAALRGLLKKHITDTVKHFKGKIWQWDVVNEAASDPWDTPNDIHYKGFWAENLGPGYIADAFRWARAADPKALLFYNDYNIEAFGDGGPQDKTQFVYDFVKDLRKQGVPIDGVGSQGHLGTQYGDFDAIQVSEALRKFTDLGVATAFTEVDVRSEMTEAVKAGNANEINPRLQASASNYSALLQGCLSNEHCLSFTVWGFTDKHSWIPNWSENKEGLANIYDENYAPKRAYRALQADLQIAGPPYVNRRVPQQPRR
jgi:endo-1,4-beta-xylanase